MAGWRSGYAADCKAPQASHENKALGRNPYQDKASTSGQHDTLPPRPQASPRHKTAARAIFDALVAGDFRGVDSALRANLSLAELSVLADAVAIAMGPEPPQLPTDVAWREIWIAVCKEWQEDGNRRLRQGRAP